VDEHHFAAGVRRRGSGPGESDAFVDKEHNRRDLVVEAPAPAAKSCLSAQVDDGSGSEAAIRPVGAVLVCTRTTAGNGIVRRLGVAAVAMPDPPSAGDLAGVFVRPGATATRLVATDASGRSSQARLAPAVVPVRLAFLIVKAPTHAARTARGGVQRSGGAHDPPVNRKPRTITISVHPGRSTCASSIPSA
jgi:hypothetical protein